MCKATVRDPAKCAKQEQIPCVPSMLAAPWGWKTLERNIFLLVMPTHFPGSWAALESQGSILVPQIHQLWRWE